jgi:hypothetical protein
MVSIRPNRDLSELELLAWVNAQYGHVQFLKAEYPDDEIDIAKEEAVYKKLQQQWVTKFGGHNER